MTSHKLILGKIRQLLCTFFTWIRKLVINVSSISKVHLSFRHKKMVLMWTCKPFTNVYTSLHRHITNRHSNFKNPFTDSWSMKSLALATCHFDPRVHGHLQYQRPTVWFSAAQDMTCRFLNFKDPSTDSWDMIGDYIYGHHCNCISVCSTCLRTSTIWETYSTVFSISSHDM